MSGLLTTIMILLVIVSLVGCSLASFPSPTSP
jgi:hypothetical protein